MNLQTTTIEIMKIIQLNEFIFITDDADNFLLMSQTNKLTAINENQNSSLSISAQVFRVR